MDSPARSRSTPNDPWRYRCPNGHTSYEPRASGGYRCQMCALVFDELRDAKTL